MVKSLSLLCSLRFSRQINSLPPRGKIIQPSGCEAASYLAPQTVFCSGSCFHSAVRIAPRLHHLLYGNLFVRYGNDTIMIFLFPCHPLKSRLPDPDYESEADAAHEAGFESEFYNLELLREGRASEAFKGLSQSSPTGEPILHRGWMMSDDLYAKMHEQLVGKGYLPVVSPTQYAEAHYLPNAYPLIDGLTPHSSWMSGNDMESAWTLYQQMREDDALVKDFVKSAKHKWNEACFIPANTNRERFEQIIHAFLRARAAQFNKGIVFRRFHELVTLERDLRGQPVHEEYRMFFWQGQFLQEHRRSQVKDLTGSWKRGPK